MKSLPRRLKSLTRNKKILFLGVGNTLKGDDAAGIRLLEKLSQVSLPANGQINFLNCGISPENYLEKIKSFKPEVLIIADAAAIGKSPGTMELFDLEAVNDFSLSTHSLSLMYLKEYLKGLNCKIFLLGIQPKSCTLDTGLSAEIKDSLDRFVSCFKF